MNGREWHYGPLMTAPREVNGSVIRSLRHVLLPILRRYQDEGWPGLSERDRNEATNALWDLRAELENGQ